MCVGNVLISLGLGEMDEIFVKERTHRACWAGAQPTRGKWLHLLPAFYPVPPICPTPASGSPHARTFASALLGSVSLLSLLTVQEGIASPRVVTLPVLHAGLMSNFCPFSLPQGLPSPRVRNRHPAASHSAAHLLKNRYGGMCRSCSRK